MIEKHTTDDELYNLYLSLDVEKDAIIKQSEVIRKIASNGSLVIVGRGADYVLKENPNLVRIFLYAPLEYRINKVSKMYGDTYEKAKKHVLDSDKSRASYYEVITNNVWGRTENYDLCINCEIGSDEVINIICSYINSKMKK